MPRPAELSCGSMLLRKPDLSAVPFICVAAIIAGMLLDPARAMPSIAMMVMSAYVLFSNPVKNFSLFFRDKVLMLLVLVFFVYLLSSLNSTDDRDFLLERIRIKLPFLAMPVAFTVFANKISPRKFYSLLYLFLVIVLVTALSITFSFYKNITNMLQQYSEGHVVETPFSHIRYSLMTAFAIVVGFYLFSKNFYLRYPFERWLILLVTLFLIYFLHLLAVRSGIVALYLCGIFMIFYFIFRIKNLRIALLIGALIILIPLISYFTIPTVKAKLQYMQFDLEQLFFFNNASGLSDAGRVMSDEEGMALFREHPLTGIGIGDLRVEMKKKLGAAPENPNYLLLPHNQFLFVAAGTGIFGLIIFAAAVFLPLFRRRCVRNWLFVCFQIILLSSFLTEATIEEQIGTAFYIVFLLLIYFFLEYNDSVSTE